MKHKEQKEKSKLHPDRTFRHDFTVLVQSELKLYEDEGSEPKLQEGLNLRNKRLNCVAFTTFWWLLFPERVDI